jgi:hypothetical protein
MQQKVSHDGPDLRICLKCGKSFKSTGFANRRCKLCIKKADNIGGRDCKSHCPEVIEE